MESFDPRDLDRIVEAKLKEAPMSPVPLGLCRDVRRRVAGVAVARRERRRYHKLLSGSFFLFTGIALMIGVAAIVFDIPGRLALAIPGILGTFDYVGSSVGHPWILTAALGTPMGLLAVGAALWVGLRSTR